MKKNYTLLALCMLMSGLMVFSQTTVTLKVDDSANKDKTAIKFKGQFNDWADVDAYDDGTNGDAVAGDNIWSLAIQVANDGTYEWGSTDQDGAWLTPGVPNYTFTVDSGEVTGQTTITIEPFGTMHPVKFTVVDDTKTETEIKIKGSMFGWADRLMYDDGTNGDETAGDNIWTLEVEVEEGSWEWGIENQCGWKLVGSNRNFTLNSDGSTTGDISYTIPGRDGAAVMVTFRVDMSDEIPSADGIFVSGNFMDNIADETYCNWAKTELKLVGEGDIFEIKLPIYKGSYQWKFFNGNCGDDGCQENGDFGTSGCGSDNGLGGWNRDVTISGDTVLPLYMYNSCDLSTASISKVNNAFHFNVYPNPAINNATISFLNTKNSLTTVSLLDLQGRTITSNEDRASNITLNWGNIQSGVYLIQVYNENGSSFKKIIIE